MTDQKKSKVSEKIEKKTLELTGGTYPQEVKQQALAMHLNLCSISEIAEKLSLKESTIDKWTRSPHWRKSREKLSKAVFGNLYKQRREEMEDIIGLGLKIVFRGLTELEVNNAALPPKSIQNLMGVIADANKLLCLEEGKPTDITKTVSIKETRKNVIELIKSDPFEEFKEADLNGEGEA